MRSSVRGWGTLRIVYPGQRYCLTARPQKDIYAIELVRSYAVTGEQLEVVDKVAYLFTLHGFGTSKLAERFDKAIGVPNTARNWNWVLKFLEFADAVARNTTE